MSIRFVMAVALNIGLVGIWSRAPQWGEAADASDVAAELETLGFGAVWLGASPSGDLAIPERLLQATERMIIGTSIVNIWKDPADVVARSFHRLAGSYPGRFILGLGVGHADSVGSAYQHPLSKLNQYLDDLDAASPPVPHEDRAIGALGPRALELAKKRSLGSLPYLTTPEHTRIARDILGPDVFLAPEQKVVLDGDPESAHQIGRASVAGYLRLPNYLNNLRRLGFDDRDFQDGGSDRLIEALVAWGDAGAIRERIKDHLEAGADHVAVQVLTAQRDALPRAQFRELATTLGDLISL